MRTNINPTWLVQFFYSFNYYIPQIAISNLSYFDVPWLIYNIYAFSYFCNASGYDGFVLINKIKTNPSNSLRNYTSKTFL